MTAGLSVFLKSEMPLIRLETLIHAPIERCFDLSRDIDLHMRSTEETQEIAVAGVTTGLIGLGEEVTWEATRFGVRQKLTTRITAFSRPGHFRDSQVRGAFRRFDHDHYFITLDGGGTSIQRRRSALSLDWNDGNAHPERKRCRRVVAASNGST